MKQLLGIKSQVNKQRLFQIVFNCSEDTFIQKEYNRIAVRQILKKCDDERPIMQELLQSELDLDQQNLMDKQKEGQQLWGRLKTIMQEDL